MHEWPKLLGLLGLALDIVGFAIIGWHLWLEPMKRPLLGGSAPSYGLGMFAFLLILLGFGLQALSVALQIDWSVAARLLL